MSSATGSREHSERENEKAVNTDADFCHCLPLRSNDPPGAKKVRTYEGIEWGGGELPRPCWEIQVGGSDGGDW